jgi:hypothetical protein
LYPCACGEGYGYFALTKSYCIRLFPGADFRIGGERCGYFALKARGRWFESNTIT